MMSGFMMLPHKPGVCQMCAKDHRPNEPHNRDSLHYQYAFYREHGRWPQWSDAIAHCAPEVQAAWKSLLIEHGAWTDNPKVPETVPDGNTIGHVTEMRMEEPPSEETD